MTNDHDFAAAVQAADLPGAIGLILDADGTRYARAFGQADLASGAPMRVETPVQIASMTKAIVTVGAMQLVEQGRLDLDEPIGKLLPELAEPHVLTGFGWHVAKLPKKADPGAADTRAFLVDRGGNVSWCRVTGRGRVVACAALRATGNGWQTGRSAHIARALRYGSTLNRAWVPTSAGPALCGRTGTVEQQRVGCHVLTSSGWRFTGSQRTPWGLPGYRAFVPSGAGVAYCRTIAVTKGTALSCTPMSRLDWGVTRTSRRAPLPLADAF